MKPNRTFSHLENPYFKDRDDFSDSLLGREQRLFSLRRQEFSDGYSFASNLVYQDCKYRRDFLWLPDANIAIREGAQVIWDALQSAYAISFSRQCLLLPPIEHELTKWLHDPWRNKSLAESINQCIARGRGFCSFADPDDFFEGYDRLATYYIRLVCSRRNLAIPLDDGKTLLNVDPKNKSLAISKAMDFGGPRAAMFAKAGRDDFDKNGVVNANDEALVVLAFMTAVKRRQNVCILTTDSDVLDVYYKFQWFLDTHYRSYLAGQRIALGGYKEVEVSDLSKVATGFEGPVKFYEKLSYTFDEVQPHSDTPLYFDLVYIDGQATAHLLTIPWEPGIMNMFSQKLDDGRNCSLFSDKNVHIATNPLGQEVAKCILLGKDKVVHGRDVDSIPIAWLDFIHGIHSQERIALQRQLHLPDSLSP